MKGPLEYLCQTCVTTCGIFVYTAVLIISIINQNLKATIHTLLRALMEYFLCLFIPDRQRRILIFDFIKKEREMGEGGGGQFSQEKYLTTVKYLCQTCIATSGVFTSTAKVMVIFVVNQLL